MAVAARTEPVAWVQISIMGKSEFWAFSMGPIVNKMQMTMP